MVSRENIQQVLYLYFARCRDHRWLWSILNILISSPVGHGIPGVLFSISKNNGIMRSHNLYSSIITSALTVGFGGSVGLEGPTVATGGAIGSNIGKAFKLKL